jgi:hypothetical protein
MSSSQRGIHQPALSGSFQQNQRQYDTQATFFAAPNYARLLQPLREQYERKLNTDELPDDVDKRLQKSLQHYMREVFRVNGTTTPISSLNQEAYRETTLNFDGWLQKQVPSSIPKRPIATQSNQDPLFESVGNRFEREQQNRSSVPLQAIPTMDFSVSNDDEDAEDPLEKYERLRKQRELEGKTSNLNKVKISDQYSEPSAPSATTQIPPVQQNNPPPPPLLAPRPQEFIIKQEDVVKYKENEQNLFIYSGDRDWLANRNENRYNFTINFNSVSSTNSATYSPSVKERFKNIVRMELVKAILSSEPLEFSVRVSSGLPNTDRVINLLSYPYVMIRISEWTSNGFGTNANIDNAFGLVQYDQTWKSDSSAPNFGYISMTPRYLKAQRVYTPTPLATIQKLSFQVERPDGNPLTTMLDTLDIGNIYLASNVGGSAYAVSPDTESYIFIKTKTWFSRFFVNDGDRIQIRGYDIGIASYQNDFNNFINSTDGHIVVGTAYTDSSLTLKDNYNAVGYSDFIIIRSRFEDPTTTGGQSRNYFGGTPTTEADVSTRLLSASPSTNCALLNTNRQSHFVLRIITREMDASSNLRPDNS